MAVASPLDAVLALGFPQVAASAALVASGGDVHQAIDYLLVTQQQQLEPEPQLGPEPEPEAAIDSNQTQFHVLYAGKVHYLSLLPTALEAMTGVPVDEQSLRYNNDFLKDKSKTIVDVGTKKGTRVPLRWVKDFQQACTSDSAGAKLAMMMGNMSQKYSRNAEEKQNFDAMAAAQRLLVDQRESRLQLAQKKQASQATRALARLVRTASDVHPQFSS